MGGLFSSDPVPTPRIRPDFGTYHHTQVQVNRANNYRTPQTPTWTARDIERAAYEAYRYENGYAAVRAPIRSCFRVRPESRSSRPPLLPFVLKISDTSNWTADHTNVKKAYLVTLSCNSMEFVRIEKLFMSTTKRYFKISTIERLENPYLMAQYSLRKEEMSHVLNGPVEEELLFHGTETKNVQTICDKNFDWRISGRHIGHRFGRGVSFSKISYYASHYSSKKKYDVKKMFLVKVIIGNSCIGNVDMLFPNPGCDTSIKPGGKDVLVKYQDYEFYPAYIITYTAVVPRKKTPQNYDFDYYDDLS